MLLLADRGESVAIKESRWGWYRRVAVILLFIPALPAASQEIPGYPSMDANNYDSREIAMLPPYCPYAQIFRDRVAGAKVDSEIQRWYAQLGATFHHMHHYCWGLMKTNRAVLLARSRDIRDFYLRDSIGEFEYVIQRAPSDFVLLPEIITKQSENLARLGKGPVAVLGFERAAELKPDYWPPYAHISDYYKEAGDIPKARAALEKGLSFAPDASALKRRLTELEQSQAARRPASKP